METYNDLDRLRHGMRAMSADGYVLGTVSRLIEDESYAFVEVAPITSVWTRWLFSKKLFLPMIAVAEVLDNHVVLKLDARAAKAYTAQPDWGARGDRRGAAWPFGGSGSGGWDGGGWDGGGCGYGDGGFGGDGGGCGGGGD